MGTVKAENWKKSFPAHILSRGRSYYDWKRFEQLNYEKNEVTSLVTGGLKYSVRITHLGRGELALSCSCPYSEGGANCKHEAAVLYAIESVRPELLERWANDGKKPLPLTETTNNTKRTAEVKVPSEKRRVYPFKNDSEETGSVENTYRDEYEYFDFEKLTENTRITFGQYEKAKKLVDEGRVKICFTRNEYYRPIYNDDDKKCVTVFALVHVDDKRPESVSLTIAKDRLIEASCNCKRCYGYNNVANRYSPFVREDETFCEHVLALLLMSREYFRHEKPEDSTDATTVELLKRFRRNKSADAVGDDGEEINLVPKLRFGDGMQLEFKIGKDKLYVLKSIEELIDNVKEKKIMPLGTKTKIDFATAHFSEQSEKLYNLIRDGIEEERRRREATSGGYYPHYNYDRDAKSKYFMLYGNRLDRFFDMYRDSKITAVKKNGSERQIEFREKELKLDVKIAPDKNNGRFDGIHVEVEQPDLYEGVESVYYYDGSYINKVTEECLEAVGPLLDKDYEALYFDIGRNHLSEFYHNLLPQIEPYTRIKTVNPEEIERYIAPEADFRFYLDATKEELTCRIEVAYGDDTFTIMPVKNGVGLIGKAGFRDNAMELRVMEAGALFFPEPDYERGFFVLGTEDPDRVFEVLSFGVNKLMEYGEVHATDEFLNFRIKKKWNLTVGVKLESDLMSVNVISNDISPAELLDILKSYKKKKKYHRLKNGDFIHIEEDENLQMLYEMMENLGVTPKELVSGKMHVPKYRALYLNKMMEEHEEIVSERDRNFKNLVKSFKTLRDADYDLPEGIDAEVRSYQKQGFRWMMTCTDCGFGGILADDMGLGKTLQAICVILYAKKNYEYKTGIIVSPASLVYNWQYEINRFAPELTCHTITGTKPEREELLYDVSRWDVIITSYDLLKRDIDLYEGKEFSFAFIDEAQYIKNPGSIAAKSVKLLKAGHRFALTGTPIENKLSEMWSIFDFLMPGYLYGYERFHRDFERPIVVGGDKGRMDKLKAMVSPFVLRRLKGDVLKELPDKLEEIRSVKFEDKQRELYDAQVTHMRVLLDKTAPEEFAKAKLQVLSELTKMRQICCNPSLLMENYKGGSAKQEALMELVEEAIDGGHKMLIFSQFTSMLALIEEDLKKRGIEYYVIIGNTPKEERIKLVNAFNSDDTPVFLISLKAGGTGLNLVGADIVIHYDPWWNVAVENQATDRAHRIGQTKVVSVFKLIAKGTIEEKIIKLQAKKRALADEILKGEGGNLASLTREELLELLEE